MEGSGQLLLGRIDVWLYGSVRLAVVHHKEGLRSAILGISVLFMVMATFMSHTATTNLLMPIAISMSTSVVSIENMGWLLSVPQWHWLLPSEWVCLSVHRLIWVIDINPVALISRLLGSGTNCTELRHPHRVIAGLTAAE